MLAKNPSAPYPEEETYLRERLKRLSRALAVSRDQSFLAAPSAFLTSLTISLLYCVFNSCYRSPTTSFLEDSSISLILFFTCSLSRTVFSKNLGILIIFTGF